jgi:hypothetical protein
VTTFTDGAPPSVAPEPDESSVPHGADPPDPDPDTGSAWLHDEIQRRIAEGAAAGGGGRHARRGEPTSSSSAGYVPRHSVATPGPGAPRPGPVGGSMSQASELLRRERTEAATVRPVWSGPPVRQVEPQPAPPEQEGGTRPVRPGIAAAAAMRGAARGRARTAAAAVQAPPLPPETAPPHQPAPRPRPAPTAAPQQASPATAPVDVAAVAPAPVESAPVEAAVPETAVPETAIVETAPAETAAPPDPPATGNTAVETSPIDPATTETPPMVVDSGPGAPTGPLPAPPIADVDPALEHTAPVPAIAPPALEPADPPPSGITVPEQRGRRDPEADGPGEPGSHESRRVRVVLAERKGVARPVRTVITIQESSGVGELLRRNLIGSQLAIALRFAIGAGLTLGLLPLLFAMVPEIGRVEVLGIRLPWLLLGVLVYPFLFGLGLWHTRTAEHLEQNFAETVQD